MKLMRIVILVVDERILMLQEDSDISANGPALSICDHALGVVVQCGFFLPSSRYRRHHDNRYILHNNNMTLVLVLPHLNVENDSILPKFVLSPWAKAIVSRG